MTDSIDTSIADLLAPSTAELPPTPRSEGTVVPALGVALISASHEDLLAYVGVLEERLRDPNEAPRHRSIELALGSARAELDRRAAHERTEDELVRQQLIGLGFDEHRAAEITRARRERLRDR
jgi:hypothetical protein